MWSQQSSQRKKVASTQNSTEETQKGRIRACAAAKPHQRQSQNAGLFYGRGFMERKSKKERKATIKLMTQPGENAERLLRVLQVDGDHDRSGEEAPSRSSTPSPRFRLIATFNSSRARLAFSPTCVWQNIFSVVRRPETAATRLRASHSPTWRKNTV